MPYSCLHHKDAFKEYAHAAGMVRGAAETDEAEADDELEELLGACRSTSAQQETAAGEKFCSCFMAAFQFKNSAGMCSRVNSIFCLLPLNIECCRGSLNMLALKALGTATACNKISCTLCRSPKPPAKGPSCISGRTPGTAPCGGSCARKSSAAPAVPPAPAGHRPPGTAPAALRVAADHCPPGTAPAAPRAAAGHRPPELHAGCATHAAVSCREYDIAATIVPTRKAHR
jgi:hypothetical protein